MLELSNITKTYKLGNNKVEALKGVSISFREKEFVSVLGPSGCGKTTLLNIIGGLDKYTTGDLKINGISTTKYKDKDWDTYRNHRVGFIFQSYNLIPHQTVLENVEIALTLSGVSRKERKQRATDALIQVGLGDKINNKPNQLSGGQMQRVAIARALVNNPEIILADEPTGALDTESSTQIMEILKNISKDRLIIMVTHNPDLAEKYSTRIVKLLDGELIGDSNPYKEKEIVDDEKKALNKSREKGKKHRMSFFTALFLSFKNLLTKKTRTILVAFAGSIGIIGIAAVLALSNGFSSYINKLQENTLSTYPITISSSSIDMSSIFSSFLTETKKKANHDLDAVYVSDRISKILDLVGSTAKTNNVDKFYKYLNDNYKKIDKYVNAVQYSYNLGMEIYNENDKLIQPNGTTLYNMIVKYSLYYFQNITKLTMVYDSNGCTFSTNEQTPLVEPDPSDQEQYAAYTAYWAVITGYIGPTKANELKTSNTTYLTVTEIANIVRNMINMNITFSFDSVHEMIDNEKLIMSQYDLVAGTFDIKSKDAYLVLNSNNEIDDYMLYALGIISEEQMNDVMEKLVAGQKRMPVYSYSDVLGKQYKILLDSDYYVKDIDGDGKLDDIRRLADTEDPYFDIAEYKTEYQKLLDNCTNVIEVKGVLRLKSTVEAGSLETGVLYTSELTKDLVAYYNISDAVTSGVVSELHLDSPESINIYVSSFKAKDKIKKFISNYNASVSAEDEITYSDNAGLIMSTVATIINAITYVLVAFVSVSLIVSSIMIGVITYISVIERTKEIGVLRSIGASKADVRHVFTAESFIIGLTSGVFGILVALLLTIPINFVLKHFTGIYGIANLPWYAAIILVVISIALTLIAGLIPARLAAKRDPVEALRSN